MIYLLELVVTTCHDIAVHLFTVMDEGLRPRPMTPRPKPMAPRLDEISHASLRPDLYPLPPTMFSWDAYKNVDEYPQGVADCVGYWAEAHIFGGIAIFDRGQSGLEVSFRQTWFLEGKTSADNKCIQSKSAFMHPGGPYMIFEMSENQLRGLLHFGAGTVEQDAPPPFPWRTEEWARRVDPYENLNLGIYRDRYERRISVPLGWRCVRRLEDDPEMQDIMERLNRSSEIHGHNINLIAARNAAYDVGLSRE
jgi:hypothetical protein